MQACLSTGAYCAIDIHNFARVSTKIIGQGGPSDDQFADLWSQLATKYRDEEKVIFGLMNEPHDVDISIWANTVQAAVSAIRDTGATSQLILMPGNNFASAGQFVSNGSGAALLNVKNPNGTIDGLIMDLHKYLDVDNSGEHSTCTTDNINDAFAIVAAFLRENGRQGLVSETGAGSDSSVRVTRAIQLWYPLKLTAFQCFTDFCAQNAYLNENSDVFLGYIAWAAGSFSTSYVLSLTPSKKNGKYIDTALASQCVIAPWLSAGTQIVTSAVPILTTQSTAASTSTSRGSQSLPVTSTAMGSTALTTSPGVFLGSSQNSKTSVPVVTQSTNGTIAGSTLTASITNPTKSTPTQSFTSAAYLGAIRNPLFTAASCLLATFLT